MNYFIANQDQYSWIGPVFSGVTTLLKDFGPVAGTLSILAIGILFVFGLVLFFNFPYILQRVFNKDKDAKELSDKYEKILYAIELNTQKIGEQNFHLNKLLASITDENYKNLSSKLLKLYLMQLKSQLTDLIKNNKINKDTFNILKLDSKDIFKKDILDILKRFILNEQAFEVDVEKNIYPLLDDILDSFFSMKDMLQSDNFESETKPRLEYLLNIKRQDIEKTLVEVYKSIIQADTNILYFKKVER